MVDILGKRIGSCLILGIFGLHIIWFLTWIILFSTICDIDLKECNQILNYVQRNYIFSIITLIFWVCLFLSHCFNHFRDRHDVIWIEYLKMVAIFLFYLTGFILFVALTITYYDEEECQNSKVLDVVFGHIIAVCILYAFVLSIFVGSLVYGFVVICFRS